LQTHKQLCTKVGIKVLEGLKDDIDALLRLRLLPILTSWWV
jgi:hypothetical protein